MHSLPDILNTFDSVIDNVSDKKLCPNLQISGQCVILGYSVDSSETGRDGIQIIVGYYFLFLNPHYSETN